MVKTNLIPAARLHPWSVGRDEANQAQHPLRQHHQPHSLQDGQQGLDRLGLPFVTQAPPWAVIQAGGIFHLLR